MKAILVIDMPDSCKNCQFHEIESNLNELYYGYEPFNNYDIVYHHECSLMEEENNNFKGVRIMNFKERPCWCPLRPMPEKMERSPRFTGFRYENGWNDCIDTILGETYEENDNN